MWCSPARFAASLFTFSILVSLSGLYPPAVKKIVIKTAVFVALFVMLI